jgi:hypothetical protein
VTGVLILSKDADGKVDARAADLPGASEGAGELVKRTIASGYSAVSPEFHPVPGLTRWKRPPPRPAGNNDGCWLTSDER